MHNQNIIKESEKKFEKKLVKEAYIEQRKIELLEKNNDKTFIKEKEEFWTEIMGY